MDIVHEKRSLVCSVEKMVENKYCVTFMPRQNGKHRVYIYFNGYDVKGSPYIMRVGTKGRSGKTRSSPIHDSRYRSESPSMHFNTSMLKTTETTRRELYSPDNYKASSYSPQLSPTLESQIIPNDDHIKTSKEIYSSRYKSPSPKRDLYSPKRELYSPKRELYSPQRDLYSPKLVDDQQYSSTYKSEYRKQVRQTQSPQAFDYPSINNRSSNLTDFGSINRTSNISKTNLTSNKEDNLYSTSYYSKVKSDRKTESPILVSSPINVSFTKIIFRKINNNILFKMRTTSPVIRNSPLTVTTSYERHTTSSPSRNYAASPSPRLPSESPVRYFSSTTTTSPLNLSSNVDSKINSETYKVTKQTYKTTTVNQSASPVFISSTKRIPSPGMNSFLIAFTR